MSQPAFAVTDEPDLTTPVPPAKGLAHRSALRGIGVVALWVFAAIPLGLALLAAIRAPRMHVLLDYWHVLAKVTDDNGNLLLSQVFTYHLDQPFAVPSLLFWADAAWFGGDNRVLTVLTVALLAGTVLALRTMLSPHLSPVVRTALTAGMSWLLFTSHAAELWLQGTNGISWVPAIAFCAIAIAIAHHGRLLLAMIAAVFGCLSFGAALPIWFVIALILWLRKESRIRTIAPLIVGLLVVTTWWLTKPSGTQSAATSAFDPDGRLSVVAAAAGGLWSVDTAAIAVIAGGLTFTLLAVLTRSTISDRLKQRVSTADAGWIGLAGYALTLAIMLGLGRTTNQVPGGNVGLISRYVLVAALATIALIVLTTLHRPQWPYRYVVTTVVALSLITHAIGGVKADNVRRDYAPLALSAIALRVDAPSVLTTLHIQREAAPAARALHAYPFTDAFTLGCGRLELGSHLNIADAQPLPTTPQATTHGAIDSPAVVGDAILTGWAAIDGASPDCVVVTDTNGTVLGGGLLAIPLITNQPTTAPPGATIWQAIAGQTPQQLAVIAIKNGHPYRLEQAKASA